jgi:hypothetical protein
MRRFLIASTMAGFASVLLVMGAGAQVDSVAIAEELNAAWENAQTRAGRAGDEALTCDQLEMEWESAQSDPNIQQRLASLDAGAQEAMRRYENAKTLGMAMGVGRAVLGAAVAGNQWAEQINLFAAYFQMAIMTAQANAAAPLAAAMKANVLAILPHYARTERVIQLAQDKDCAFMRPAQ